MLDGMESSSSRVVLSGVTGYIGSAVAAELADRGHTVVATVRHRAGDPGIDPRVMSGCEIRQVDYDDPGALRNGLRDTGATAIVSCIASRNGLPEDAWRVDYRANRNLLSAAQALGMSHFVLLSAICVQKPRLEFQRAKLAFEAELQRSGIDYTIVRPTAFFKSLSGQVDRVRRGKPFLVFGDGAQTACKPIGRRDLAAFMVDCLQRPERRNRVLPVGGPGDALTPLAQAELLFELVSRRPDIRRVPVAVLSTGAMLAAGLSPVFPALKAKAELARIGRYYATESMLVWDPSRQRYDADATPSTGSETLREHYRRMLRDGSAGHEPGDHKLFR